MLGTGVIPYIVRMPNKFKIEHLGRNSTCMKPHIRDYELKIFNLFDAIVVLISLVEYAA
jgi:hypothetical protein